MSVNTLIILAAGSGSRFGGLKQVYEFTHLKKFILEFSIHDAIEVGFNHIIIVVREDFLANIKEKLQWINCKIKINFCCQEDFFSGKNKLKGTGIALLSCRKLVQNRFVVINADDYYGKSVFRKAVNEFDTSKKEYFGAIIPYNLEDTLIGKEKVSRAKCVFQDSILTSVIENNYCTSSDDCIDTVENKTIELVSMNFWLFDPEVFRYLEEYLSSFIQFEFNGSDEFQLPTFVNWLIDEKDKKIKTIGLGDKWLGVSYREDIFFVDKELSKIILENKYNLF